MRKYILLTPGPVNIKESVRKALLKPDICPREVEFGRVLLECRRKLLKAFGIENSHEVVFFTGSGTAAIEAAIVSSVPQGKKILVINNGIYAERMVIIAKRHNIDVVNLKFEITRRPDVSVVEKELRQIRGISVVAMVHHETSTGLLNPAEEVGALCRKYRKLYLVDSISGLGGERLNFKKTGVDLCASVANKCLESVPGISFILVRKKAIPNLEEVEPRSLYLNLKSNLKLQQNGDYAFTPAVQTFYAFDAALDEFIKEGVEDRIKRYKNIATLLRKSFENFGLEYLIALKYRSNTVTALYLPKSISYKKLHDFLKAKGFIIYAGQAKLKDVIFRVANMGQIKTKDIRLFLKYLKAILFK